jgi:hypothetical protein
MVMVCQEKTQGDFYLVGSLELFGTDWMDGFQTTRQAKRFAYEYEYEQYV